jgi:hypothetical protein
MTPLPQPFNTAKRRMHHKRREQSPSAEPAMVTVVSVTRTDANRALWVFSSPVVGEPSNISGLEVGLVAPGGLEEVTAEGALLVEYDEGVVVGDAWSADPGNVTITFANGGTLQSGSGVVG